MMEGAAVANDPAYGTGVLDAVSPVLVHNMKMHLPRTNPLDFQSAFSGVRTTRQLVKVDCRTLGRLSFLIRELTRKSRSTNGFGVIRPNVGMR